MTGKPSTARHVALLLVALAIFAAAGVIAYPKYAQNAAVKEQERQLEVGEAWCAQFNQRMTADPRFAGLAAVVQPVEEPAPGAVIMIGGNVNSDADLAALKQWVGGAAAPLPVQYEVENLNKPLPRR